SPHLVHQRRQTAVVVLASVELHAAALRAGPLTERGQRYGRRGAWPLPPRRRSCNPRRDGAQSLDQAAESGSPRNGARQSRNRLLRWIDSDVDLERTAIVAGILVIDEQQDLAGLVSTELT